MNVIKGYQPNKGKLGKPPQCGSGVESLYNKHANESQEDYEKFVKWYNWFVNKIKKLDNQANFDY